MATTLFFFMTPEDELAFLRALESHSFEVYPEYCEPRYEPFIASSENRDRFEQDAYYLALPSAGETVAFPIKRGRQSGMLKIDENNSPVIHWERSVLAEGELRSGRLWAELEYLHYRPSVQPDIMRAVFEQIRSHFKKYYRASQPRGFFVGPNASRRTRQGLKLRESGRKGGLVIPHG